MKTHFVHPHYANDPNHVWAQCGHDLRGSLAYRTNTHKRTTSDPAKVTCKRCLARMPKTATPQRERITP